MECTVSYAVVVSSVMCNRLCLNVRDMVKPYEISTIRFSKFSVPVFSHTATHLTNEIIQTGDTTVDVGESVSTGPKQTIRIGLEARDRMVSPHQNFSPFL